MKCLDYGKIEGKVLDDSTLKGVTMRVAAGPDDGATNFTMRVFTVQPGGYTPKHSHGFEHEIFFHAGSGEVYFEGDVYPVRSGSVAFIDPDREHQIRNTGNGELVFVCVVPNNI